MNQEGSMMVNAIVQTLPGHSGRDCRNPVPWMAATGGLKDY